jgi:branched-chain amino acid transport system permease protein
VTNEIIGVRTPRRALTRARVLRWVVAAVILVVAYLLPQILGGSLNVYNTVITIAIFGAMVYGVDIMLSYLGEVSLGHTAMWAIGGYVTAVLGINLKLNPWLTLIGAVLASLLLAAILGLAVYRSRAFIWTLSTYAAAVVLSEVAANWQFVGGSDGLVGLPILTLDFGPISIPLQTVQQMWPVAFVVLLIVLLIVSRFRHSKLAQSSLMAHMNPDLAATMGINVSRVRFQLLLFSSIPPALGGWVYAYYRSYVSTDLFGTYFLILMLTAAALVGRRVLFGPLIGVALIISQQNLASLGTDGDQLLLGAVLVIVLVLWPAGLIGIYHTLKRLIGRAARKRGAIPEPSSSESAADSVPAEPNPKS